MRAVDGVDLDEVRGMLAADPGRMLEAVAGSGGQVREGLARFAPGGLADAGRPRAVVVAGMGGSGAAGELLGAVGAVPVPLVAIRSGVLPGWVGPLDLVVAVSCSGTTRETLRAAGEAARRGARLVGLGSAGTPLEELVVAGGGSYLPVDAHGRMPRASLWTLATPLLLAMTVLGLADVTEHDLRLTADTLDELAVQYGVEVPVEANPAKALALRLATGIPAVWGDSPLAGAAAYRAACQLEENAKLPCVHGVLPEASHNQVVAFDGPYGARRETDDIFRDPELDDPAPPALTLVLLRDAEADEADARVGSLVLDLATARGMRPLSVDARPGRPLVRYASLVAAVDWASVYTALALGVDPTPIGPIVDLKSRL